MKAKEVRETFIEFFRKKYDHVYVHSSPTIPHEDPTLLFANAGMNQFKPMFLGTADPSSDMAKLRRVVNSQKCIRAGGKHNDLDDVGKDVYHHTFFEMMGNWSFGDYFKKEICSWAWELLTEHYKLPKERMYVTYFGGEEKQGLEPDLECRQIWLDLGVPKDQILPGDIKDNFWEMGETGPCGPCSEIHFDRIGGRNASHLVNMDNPDVLEIWNLVFIQFNREPDSSLRLLPKKHIDCGMGLERVVSIMQNKRSNYDTDLFTPIFSAIQKLTNAPPYQGRVGKDDVNGLDMAYRVLADHARTITIALSDGGMPDNQGRGYVLRRILRRGVRYASEKLGAKPGVFASLVDVVVDLLKDTFPEVTKDPEFIKSVINEEETQFLKTLERGRKLLERTISRLDGTTVIPGDVAWRLYDTYGFPVDLTHLMAEEKELSVNCEEFEKCKKEAQEKSKGVSKDKDNSYRLDVHAIEDLKNRGMPYTDDACKFNYTGGADPKVNYDFNTTVAKILAIRYDGGFVDKITSGCRCGIILDQTNFYAESGGQMFDEGFMVKLNEEETEFKVENVEIKGGYVCHIGVVEGIIMVGDQMTLSFDGQRRKLLMNNHTGTHILNFALRQVLTAEADQRGSLVAPDRLRFDFTNKGAMTVDEVKRTEQIAQKMIQSEQKVFAKTAPLAVAKSIQGLRAVFGEVYPDPVRVVSVGIPVEQLEADPMSAAGSKTSIEFCGGTHLLNTGHIGDFVIVSEEAIAKGIRRIVSLTGPEASKAINKANLLEKEVSNIRNKINHNNLPYKEVVKLLTEVLEDINQAQIQHWRKEELRKTVDSIKKSQGDADRARKAGVSKEAIKYTKGLVAANTEVPYIVCELNAFAQNKVVNDALKEVKNIPALFISSDEDSNKILAMASVPKDVVAKGLKADEWVKNLAELIVGRGGGKPESAQVSGTNVAALKEALKMSHSFAQQKLGCQQVVLASPVQVEPSTPSDSTKGETKQQKKGGSQPQKKPASGLMLHTSKSSVRSLPALIAASYAKKEIGITSDFVLGKTNNAKEYVSKFGSSQTPGLETPEGCVTGSVACALALAPAALRGTSPVAQAQVIGWLNTADTDILPLVASWLSNNKKASGDAKNVAMATLSRLNSYFLTHTFLVGERLSLADVGMVCVLVPAFREGLDAKARAGLPCLTRWFNTVAHQPQVVDVLGPVKLK
ncbi:alanine--tRNA ligase, cytoplasmic [Oratosquilla oratoria]|uniref:alanine--tRNA ligase, cytoplasmic n=1 Tax=Oratosquilla oratoria TaxID=337810 RepID=UPI003F76A410